MGNVKVAAGHNGFVGCQLAQKLAVARVPHHAVIDAGQAVLGVGRVDVYKPVGGKLQRTNAALVVCHRAADLADDLQGLFFAKNCRARVALALCIVPSLMVSGQVKGQLTLLQLGLLQRKNVCV